jgi:hypothetical protein
MADELKVPEKAQQALVELSGLDDATFTELYEQMRASPPSFLGSHFADELAARLKLLKRETIDRIIPTLIGLCVTRAKVGEGFPGFADTIIRSLQKYPATPDAKLIVDGRAETLRNRLSQFLGLASFDVSARAYEILTAHQDVFVGVRLFSDLRPVFHDDVSEGPAASVIVHKLKIEYRQGSAQKEAFFALDSRDLSVLSEVIARAMRKDDALRKFLTDAKLPFLEPK